MKFIAVRCLLPITLILSLGGCKQILEDVFTESPEEVAKKRVERVLTGAIKGANNEDLQAGILNWTHKGSYNRLDVAYDDFHTWLKKKSLFRKIKKFEVLEAALEKEDSETAIVSVKINGKSYWIKVPKDEQMSWSKKLRRK